MSGTTRRLMAVAGAAALLLGLSAPPAAADPPVQARQSFTGAVTDSGEACGDPLSWEFTGDVLVTRFFQGGQLVRIHAHIQESGTVTNLTTGEVVELPRTAFLERVLLGEDGSVTIEDVGLSVRVTGDGEPLLDVGRFVVTLAPVQELLQSSGQHPIREINPFSVSDPALLGGFCDLFA